MTVCIAAICEYGNCILGAADRMMTAGDVEFEPELETSPLPTNLTPAHKLAFNKNPKIFPLTLVTTALIAGDSGLQSEIMQGVYCDVVARISADNNHWWKVSDIVDLYLRHYDRIKEKRLQHAVLEVYGLTRESFISKQAEMQPGFLMELNRKIEQFEFSFQENCPVATIITGYDRTGSGPQGEPRMVAHIYVIHPHSTNSVICCDQIGFAAIGIGGRHAESQFMLAGHSVSSPMPDTLLLTYTAKKKSEVAPGVGKGTDIFAIGSTSAFAMLNNIPDLETEKLDKIYQQMNRTQNKAFESAKKTTSRFIHAVRQAQGG